MARGGITKTDIEQARIAILARGEHASIDAVRVELGNTGSRSTIHRYMRELEDSEVQSLAGEERLSQELKQFVGQLAGRLHQEADAVIAQARDGHAQERAQREAQLSAAREEVALATQQNAALTQEQSETAAALTQTQERLTAEHIEAGRLRQEVDDAHLRLADKEQQIRSLDEKHQHAREALDHFRQSNKEQREQEKTRHDHQVQLLQTEIRQLQAAQVSKQNEVTELTKSNARLAAEFRDAQKHLTAAEWRSQSLEGTVETVKAQAREFASERNSALRDFLGLQDAHGKLQAAFAQQVEVRRQLEIELAGAKAVVSTQEQMMASLAEAIRKSQEIKQSGNVVTEHAPSLTSG